MRTFVEALERRAVESTDRVAFTYLEDGETETHHVTYGALHARALSIAHAMLAAGVRPGDRALLVFPPGIDFIAGFFGCLCAGVVAVPAYPPDPSRMARTLPRLLAIAKDAAPRVVLTTRAIVELRAGFDDEFLSLVPWLAADATAPCKDRLPAADPASLAFLQYTSGSTAAPKGVMVTHANLVANSAMIAERSEQQDGSPSLTWLPAYHDMGLIDGVLQPIWSGAPSVFMPPSAFLQRPARWLEAIGRYRVRKTGGPNFAYALCVRKVSDDERARLDLSTWKHAYCGAEPVRAETIAQFCHRFAGVGFAREAFAPVYGMAEATLMVSGSPTGPRVLACDRAALERGAVTPGDASIVSCGRPGIEVRIADPYAWTELAEDRVGEIWLKGPSVAAGYFGRPADTEAAFKAQLDGQPGHYFRTGDLGFLHAGELYVTSRAKDLLIVRGRNLVPTDVESTIEAAHKGVRLGCAVAFSVNVMGSEAVAIAAEIEPMLGFSTDEITAKIREAVSAQHDVAVGAIALLAPRSLPKTSSGKVRRQATKEAFFAGALEVLAEYRQPALEPDWRAPTVAWVSEPNDRVDAERMRRGVERVIEAWPSLQSYVYRMDSSTESRGSVEPFAVVPATGELQDAVRDAAFSDAAYELPLRVRLVTSGDRQALIVALRDWRADATVSGALIVALARAYADPDASDLGPPPAAPTPVSEVRVDAVALPNEPVSAAADAVTTLRFSLGVEASSAVRTCAERSGVDVKRWIAADFATWAARVSGVRDVCFASPTPSGWRSLRVNDPLGRWLSDVARGLDGGATGASACNLAIVERPVVADGSGRLFVPLSPPGMPFDVMLTFGFHGARLVGELTFRDAIAPRQTMQTWCESLALMVSSSAADVRGSELPWVSQRAVTQLWAAATASEMARPSSVVERFRRSIAHGAPFKCAEDWLERAELEARSNGLALALRARGLEKGDVVLLTCNPGFALVTALLAVWKAGGAVFLVHHEYPKRYLERVLARVRPKLTLTNDDVAAATPASTFVCTTALDDAAYVQLAPTETDDLRPLISSHRSLAVSGEALLEMMREDQEDMFIIRAPPWSQYVVLEAAAAFISGTRTYIAAPPEHVCQSALGHRLYDNSITCLVADPSFLRVFMNGMFDHGNRFTQFKRFVVRSEAPPAHQLFRLRERAPQATLIGVYSLAELGGPVMRSTSPDLRRYEALPHMTVRVLDRAGALVAPGVFGEVCVGGVTLAKGIAAAAFVDDPLAQGTRLLRTGDRGRWLADGRLEIGGRDDTVIKMWDFRIALSAMARELREYPGTTDAHVERFVNHQGVVALAAFVVCPAADERASADTLLRPFLTARFPYFVLPESFQIVKEIPRRADGSLDRERLPPPWGPIRGARPAPPETPMERVLAEVWSGVLGLADIGRDQDFFDLGGDSFLGLQMMNAAQARGLPVTPALFSAHRTIRTLAEKMASHSLLRHP